MSPFVANHSTARRHRESIREHGLLAGSPHDARPHGVYVFSDDYSHPTFSRSARGACRWGWCPPCDLWQVAYIGPMTPDCYVENGIVLLESVPPQCISLITLITRSVEGGK